MSFPNRVWFDTGNGWASRSVMPPDGPRREIIAHICGDRDRINGRPRVLVAGELDELTRMAAGYWDVCHLFQETNEQLAARQALE